MELNVVPYADKLYQVHILFRCFCMEKKNRGRKGSKKGAPRSPFAGIGKPRVSPEVALADAKRKADSLKKVNFDVDLELFGDAGTMVGSVGLSVDRSIDRFVGPSVGRWVRRSVGRSVSRLVGRSAGPYVMVGMTFVCCCR